MTASQLIDQLREELPDSSASDRQTWAIRIITGSPPVRELLPLLQAERTVAIRCVWLIGDIVEISPGTVKAILVELFNRRHEIKIPHFERSLSKFLLYCGIPVSITGEATNCLFEWLQAKDHLVTTKRFAMLALANLCKRHPDLLPELKLVLTTIQTWHSRAFSKQVERLLEKLEAQA